MKGIFLQPDTNITSPCSKDGAPHSVHHTLAEGFGWGGDIFIMCPYHKKKPLYLESQKDLPIFIIDTLCERHFSVLYPRMYGNAKQLQEDAPEGCVPVDLEKRFFIKRSASVPQRGPGSRLFRNITKKRRKRRRDNRPTSPIFTEREALIRKITSQRRRLKLTGNTDMVLERLIQRCKRPRSYRVSNIYRT